MNLVLIATGVIIFAGFAIGVYRGAVRIAVSLVTTVLTLVLVTFATPYVAKAICNLTPLDDAIREQIDSAMVNAAASLAAGEEGGGLSEDGVRKVLGAAGISEEQLAAFGISIEDIVSGKVTGDELAQYGISSSILDGLENNDSAQSAVADAEIPRDVQVAAIESSDLPELFKNLLSSNNNNEIYKELGVDTFGQYVGSFLAKLIIHIFAFLCTFIIVTIILRAIIFALDIVSELPGVGFINRLGGGAAGIVCALVIVWVMYLIITLLYVTEFGKGLYDMIQENAVLSIIYEYNPIMRLATRV